MATDTITGALSAKDTLGVEHTIFPQTNISAVQGLQTELNEIILDEVRPSHTSGYYDSTGAIIAPSSPWGDFFCYAVSGCTNCPEGYTGGFLMMFYGTSTSISGYFQVFFVDTTPFKVFIRRSKGNSTAKTWKQISA